MVELLEKVLAFSLKLDLVFPHQKLAEDVAFFNKKSKFFIETEIFSWVVEILESMESGGELGLT